MNIDTTSKQSTAWAALAWVKNYPDRVEVDEYIVKLPQQKETRRHALTTWYCICNAAASNQSQSATLCIFKLQHFIKMLTSYTHSHIYTLRNCLTGLFSTIICQSKAGSLGKPSRTATARYFKAKLPYIRKASDQTAFLM